MPPVTEWSPPIATVGVPAFAARAKKSVIRSMQRSLSFASGNGTSPRSWIRHASHGEKPKAA